MAKESDLLEMLRTLISDDDPQKNILNMKRKQFTDTQLSMFLKMALSDFNVRPPRSGYTTDTLPDVTAVILVCGAAMFLCLSEGILQLRNNIAYSDAGLTVDMFNKSGGYQSYAGTIAQMYFAQRDGYKAGELANQIGAGFIGIASQFNPWWAGSGGR